MASASIFFYQLWQNMEFKIPKKSKVFCVIAFFKRFFFSVCVTNLGHERMQLVQHEHKLVQHEHRFGMLYAIIFLKIEIVSR